MSQHSECVQLWENNLLPYVIVPKKQQDLQNSAGEIFQPRMPKGFSQDRRWRNIFGLLQKYADSSALHPWNNLLWRVGKRSPVDLWLDADRMEAIRCYQGHFVWWGSSWEIAYWERKLHWWTCCQCTLHHLRRWLHHLRRGSQDSNCWYPRYLALDQRGLQKQGADQVETGPDIWGVGGGHPAQQHPPRMLQLVVPGRQGRVHSRHFPRLYWQTHLLKFQSYLRLPLNRNKSSDRKRRRYTWKQPLRFIRTEIRPKTT